MARCDGPWPSETGSSGGENRLGGRRTVGARTEGDDEAPVANPWPWHGPSEDDDDELGATVYPRARAASTTTEKAAAPEGPPARPITDNAPAAPADPPRHRRSAAPGTPRTPSPSAAAHAYEVPAYDTRPSPARAVSRPWEPQAHHAPTLEPPSPSPHTYGYGFYAPTVASYPGPRPTGVPHPGPGYPSQPTYASPNGPPAPYAPPLPPRPSPAPFAPLPTGFGSDPRSSVSFPPPPMNAGRPRASSSSVFGTSSARRWLDRTSQMLEAKLDEVLHPGPQPPPRRPVYGSYPASGRPPVPGPGRYRGASWSGGSYRYA